MEPPISVIKIIPATEKTNGKKRVSINIYQKWDTVQGEHR